MQKKNMKKIIKQVVAGMAKKTAVMEANTACPFMNFQPEEPKAVRKLRKF